MAENGRSRQLIAKEQATIGTYVAPDYATDQDVYIYNLDDGSNDFGHTGGADRADGTFKKGRSYSQQKTHTRTFQTDFQPSGTLNVAPKWWKFLKGCGWTIDTTGANALATWTGRPRCQCLDIDIPQWNCTDNGGTAFVVSSATGSFELSWDNSGAVLMPSFTYTGKYGGFKDLLDTAFNLPSGVDTTPCSTFLGATLNYGGYAHNVWGGTLSQGADNQIVPNSADLTNGIKTGVSHVAVKGADVQLSLTVERIKKATYDYEADIVGNTELATVVLAFDGFEVTCGIAQAIDWQGATTNESGSFEINMKIDTIEIKQV